MRFDPVGDLLATVELEGGADGHRTALAKDEAVIVRVRAAAALAKDATQATVDALAKALHDPFWGVGAEAAAALGRVRTSAARDALVAGLTTVKHPKARRALAAALGAFRGDDLAGGALARLLERGDASLFVEATAAAALGAVRSPGAFETLAQALATKDSWIETIRMGCVRGLSALCDERALPLLLARLSPREATRLRSAAAGALAVLGRRLVQREAVREALIDLLGDPSFPVAMNAIAALRILGDDRALGALHAVAESGADGRIKRAARIAAGRIGRGAERTKEVARLSDDLEGLRRTNLDLVSRLERLETKLTPSGKGPAKAGARRSVGAKTQPKRAPTPRRAARSSVSRPRGRRKR